jgi:hypothetical protein
MGSGHTHTNTRIRQTIFLSLSFSSFSPYLTSLCSCKQAADKSLFFLSLSLLSSPYNSCTSGSK